MAKIKKIKGKLGAPSDKKKIKDKKIKNRYLNVDGSFDLIEEFPVYKDRKKRKKRKRRR